MPLSVVCCKLPFLASCTGCLSAFFFAYFMVGILAMVVLYVPIVGDLVIRRDTCQLMSVNIMSRARSK